MRCRTSARSTTVRSPSARSLSGRPRRTPSSWGRPTRWSACWAEAYSAASDCSAGVTSSSHRPTPTPTPAASTSPASRSRRRTVIRRPATRGRTTRWKAPVTSYREWGRIRPTRCWTPRGRCWTRRVRCWTLRARCSIRPGPWWLLRSPGSGRAAATVVGSALHGQRHGRAPLERAALGGLGRGDEGVVDGQGVAAVRHHQARVGQALGRRGERHPRDGRNPEFRVGVEGLVRLALGADRAVDPVVGVIDVDELEPLDLLVSGRWLDDHDAVLLIAGPLLVSVLELHRRLLDVSLVGKERITAGALHRGQSLRVDQDRDSCLQQGVEGDGLAVLVLVIRHESVVAQYDGCELIDMPRDLVRADIPHPRPFLRLRGVLAVGEEVLELLRIAGAGFRRAAEFTGGPIVITLPRRTVVPARRAVVSAGRAAVQPRAVAGLYAAARAGLGEAHVLAEAAVLREEGIGLRYPGGNGPHHGQLFGFAASADHQHADQQ